MVDSNDRERVNEAREELMRMLAEDELRDAALLVFANKQVFILTNEFIYLLKIYISKITYKLSLIFEGTFILSIANRICQML